MSIAHLDLCVLPTKGGDQTAQYAVIDEVIFYIQSLGLPCEVGAMGTTVQGDFDTLLDIVRQAQSICFEHGASNVYTIARFDHALQEDKSIEAKTSKFRS